MGQAISPIELQAINAKLNSTVEEMQRIIYRTGYSTIIRETRDASAGITDSNGRLIGQAFQLPLHIGVFTFAVEGLLNYFRKEEINKGDIFIMNHPYIGGSPHAPDFIVLAPFFSASRLVAFCCNIAHKADIGGLVPGSLTTKAREIFQEGLHIPPVRYYEKGVLRSDIENVIRANSRVPDQVIGDLRGQVGCTLIGRDRMEALSKRYGADLLLEASDELIRRTRLRLQDALARYDDSRGEAEGYLDHDGVDLQKPRRIHVSVAIDSRLMTFDFSSSDDQTSGPLNMRPTLLRAVCHFAAIAFLDPTVPCNHALFDIVNVKTKSGTIVDPRYPAAVNSYADVVRLTYHIVVSAVGKIFPEKAVAAGGDNRGLNISGLSPEHASKRWIFYEILGSGQGARQEIDGVSGISHFISNVAITPIEVIETEFPLAVTEFAFVCDSGGPGRRRGGLGFRRGFTFAQDCLYVHRTGVAYVHPPWELYGGMPGSVSRFRILRQGGRIEEINQIPGEYPLDKGDSAILERPGGGGCGDPRSREVEKVLEDVLDGYVSAESALRHYGVRVVIEPGSPPRAFRAVADTEVAGRHDEGRI